jgi:DNA-binding protein HU-beta
MNKKELVKLTAEKAEMTQKAVGEVLDALLTTITDELVDGGEVSIAGFGKFTIAEKAARTARNPQTGEEVVVPAHNAPKFKAAQALKDAVK